MPVAHDATGDGEATGTAVAADVEAEELHVEVQVSWRALSHSSSGNTLGIGAKRHRAVAHFVIAIGASAQYYAVAPHTHLVADLNAFAPAKVTTTTTTTILVVVISIGAAATAVAWSSARGALW